VRLQCVVCDTGGMDGNSDAAVGQRLAELRKQKELRQDDFLELLEARGVGWTRTTLSRIESGQRALKAGELFAVADAFGVDPSQLNPAAGGFYYQVQSHRLKYREATAAARQAIGAARRVRANLIALVLANEIQAGKSDFTVEGRPDQFIDNLATALSPDEDRFNTSVAEQALGIDGDEVRREYQDLASAEFGDKAPEHDDHFRLMGDAYARVFSRKFPLLKFTGEEVRDFDVDGINVDDESYKFSYMRASTLAEMLYGRDSDGR
jgi:transcriptional regulator with XRE-family HTH domain